MAPKRKAKEPAGESGGTEVVHSTIVMSVHRALQKAASTFAEDSFLVVQDVQQRLFQEVQRHVDANARLGVLASVFMGYYLAWLSDQQVYECLECVNQNVCTTAVNLVNHTGDIRVGRSQPLMIECFGEFRRIFPADFAWPNHRRSGNLAAALGREMATNYEVYEDVGFAAHAIRHLQIEAAVPKWVARKAWERANRLVPVKYGPRTLAEHEAAHRDLQTTLVEHLAERLVATARLHPVLLHRYLLRRVEERQVAAVEDEERRRTGKLFPLFPLRQIKIHFATLDVRIIHLWLTANPDVKASVQGRIEDKDLLTAFFPRRKGGWNPVNEIKTDGVRIALTYERRVPKRTTGGDTVKDGRKRTKKEKATIASTTVPYVVPRNLDQDSLLPRIDILTAPKGMYNLNEVLQDASFAHDEHANSQIWQGFDPGLTTLYEGHRGTRRTRKQWRFETGAVQATQKANRRNQVIEPVLVRLSLASLKSADAGILFAWLRDAWVPNWSVLWQHFGARWWGHQRFRSQIKHQSVLDAVANQVLGKDHSRIAVFGDGVFPSSMRGIPPAPVTKVRNYLARKGRVVLVDEYRTSKICHKCYSEMEQHPSRHTTKHCKSVCRLSRNRDGNAAQNIATLFKAHMSGLPRPVAMRRNLNTMILGRHTTEHPVVSDQDRAHQRASTPQ